MKVACTVWSGGKRSRNGIPTEVVTYHYFLGLRTLTVIDKTIKQVYKNKGIKIDLYNLDYDEKEVYNSLSRGNTEGVFQLESRGMMNFMKELKPESLEDVIAGISLYRPGPMDFIPQYIRGKNEKGETVYKCKELKPILESTYGCMVYQEQVMQIVRDLAGYSYGRSDLVRRAMSKKDASVMEKERQNFIYGNEEQNIPGCIKKGINEKVAGEIFDEMMDFANYAFNKSHAACYAYLAYQTAYLKYHYPLEFMAALMSSVMDDTGKICEYIVACKKMGINILPPDVNKGYSDFSVDNGAIRVGLAFIKNVGKTATGNLVSEREKNGEFYSLSNMIERLDEKGINKRGIENFIYSGACDCFKGNRKQKLISAQDLIDNKKKKKDNIKGQISLFELNAGTENFDNDILPDINEMSERELLEGEKEVLGFYISGHPVESDIDIIEQICNIQSNDFSVDSADENNTESEYYDSQPVSIGGIINNVNKRITKKGDIMAFVNLEDMYGTMEAVVFPKVYEKYKDILTEGNKIIVAGKIQLNDNSNSKLIAENIILIDDIPSVLWVKFDNNHEFDKRRNELLSDLNDYKGVNKVKIYLEEEKQVVVLNDDMGVNINKEIMSILKLKYDEKNIKRVVDKKTVGKFIFK